MSKEIFIKIIDNGIIVQSTECPRTKNEETTTQLFEMTDDFDFINEDKPQRTQNLDKLISALNHITYEIGYRSKDSSNHNLTILDDFNAKEEFGDSLEELK